MFSWQKLFQNRNIHDQVRLFNETKVNIFHNYFLNKRITCSDKYAPLLNDHINRHINQKNEIFKKYLRDGRPNSVYENLQFTAWDLTEAIISSKNLYYERLASKLNS